jgi:hypothetical protein
MSFDRIVLVVSGVFVAFAGIACLVAPESFTQQAGLSATPSGLTEIRAFYGGLQAGLGCFLIWCSRQPTLVLPGLLLVGFSVGAIGLARATGMLVDQAPTAYHVESRPRDDDRHRRGSCRSEETQARGSMSPLPNKALQRSPNSLFRSICAGILATSGSVPPLAVSAVWCS